MKLKVSKEFVDKLRASIQQTRKDIQTNREQRKQLIREIRAMKTNIKQGENLCSKLEVGLIVDVGYLRDDLKKKRSALNDMRAKLLHAEVQHAVSKAICRAVHKQLDRLNEPFDPERARTAGR